MKDLYDPHPHSWQARMHLYTGHPVAEHPVAQQTALEQLRKQWQSDPTVKNHLLVIAKQVRRYGWQKTWSSYLPLHYSKPVLQQAVRGILQHRLV